MKNSSGPSHIHITSIFSTCGPRFFFRIQIFTYIVILEARIKALQKCCAGACRTVISVIAHERLERKTLYELLSSYFDLPMSRAVSVSADTCF
jgi:hypothetical protein